tara:strand:- start:83 stop:391 length:309 start_codon:yes stop_codon:yes gene_type:complete
MFKKTPFNQPVGGWKVSNVRNMSGMFEQTEFFNQPLGKWDVSNVKFIHAMFDNAKAFNQSITEWTVTTSTEGMFRGADKMEKANADWYNWTGKKAGRRWSAR